MIWWAGMEKDWKYHPNVLWTHQNFWKIFQPMIKTFPTHQGQSFKIISPFSRGLYFIICLLSLFSPQAGALHHSIWREQVLLGKGWFDYKGISQHHGLKRNICQYLLEEFGLITKEYLNILFWNETSPNKSRRGFFKKKYLSTYPGRGCFKKKDLSACTNSLGNGKWDSKRQAPNEMVQFAGYRHNNVRRNVGDILRT